MEKKIGNKIKKVESLHESRKKVNQIKKKLESHWMKVGKQERLSAKGQYIG